MVRCRWGDLCYLHPTFHVDKADSEEKRFILNTKRMNHSLEAGSSGWRTPTTYATCTTRASSGGRRLTSATPSTTYPCPVGRFSGMLGMTDGTHNWRWRSLPGGCPPRFFRPCAANVLLSSYRTLGRRCELAAEAIANVGKPGWGPKPTVPTEGAEVLAEHPIEFRHLHPHPHEGKPQCPEGAQHPSQGPVCQLLAEGQLLDI